MIITKKYRIKDSTSKKKLRAMANSVNFVWNFCNETSVAYIDKKSKWLTNYDLHKETAGCSKELRLNSTTVQAVCDEYVVRRKQFKKKKLNWRSKKKSLGWIPFKGNAVKYKGTGLIEHNGYSFKFWESQHVGKIKCGSFNEDSKGNWYINLVVEVEDYSYKKTGKEVGVDLGLKTTASYSDGTEFVGIKATKMYANKLAIVQRAKKKKQVAAIHTKIKNVRKDSIHKETLRLVKEYDLIVVGDVSSMKLVKTKMAKSTLDNSWGAYKSILAYKTIRFGKEMKVVKENWTTVTCSDCLERSFPKKSGLSSLSVREWTCGCCGSIHNRDTNAAKNILRIGHDTLNKGIPSL